MLQEYARITTGKQICAQKFVPNHRVTFPNSEYPIFTISSRHCNLSQNYF